MRNNMQNLWAALRWRLTKPEYLFQPMAVFRRFRRRWDSAGAPYRTVKLNWGLPLRVKTNDAVAAGILRTRLDDVTQSEVIWRLLSPGETAVDIGANIGYVSSLMAVRVGPAGRVMAFEPHPGLCEELRTNVRAWGDSYGRVEVYQTALSERAGMARLGMPPTFAENRGLSRVLPSGEGGAAATSFRVELRRLDDIFDGSDDDGPIALMKIDVEGHELEVLKGAQRLLGSKAIRNIVFEDFGGGESASMRLLQASGYTIWQIVCDLLGPRLLAPGVRKQASWLPSNYLASLTPENVQHRIRKRGWRVLRTTKSGG